MPQTQFLSAIRKFPDWIEFVAVVPDMVQVAPATRWDPPEFGSAQCRGRLSWDPYVDGDPLALTDEQLERLCQDPSIDWELDPNAF